MNYRGLLDSASQQHALAEPVPRPLPPELELQALWFSGAFGRQFTTTKGTPFKVIQFGEWNRSAGPDFIQAVIEFDGTRRAGSIELDPCANSWNQHGHATNPSYDGVILHVVFQQSSLTHFTRTSTHHEVPTLFIHDEMLEEALNLPRRDVAVAKRGRCASVLSNLNSDAIDILLKEAALYRAAKKSQRFLRTADAHGRDAALYQSVAETLGYRNNALSMKLLAQRASLSAIKVEDSPPEAMLFGTAGFLSPSLHERAPEDSRDYLRGLWDHWWKQRGRFEPDPTRDFPWIMRGHRPANHPHRRVGTLAALVREWPKFRRLALARPFQAEPLLTFLESLKHPFWTYRYTLTSAAIPEPVALFGKSRALELLANHLIPLALFEGPSFKIEDYLALRGPSPNDQVKRCGLRLFGSPESAKPWMRGLAYQQAMLQIYRDFCLQDFSDCESCGFPEQLAQWKPNPQP